MCEAEEPTKSSSFSDLRGEPGSKRSSCIPALGGSCDIQQHALMFVQESSYGRLEKECRVVVVGEGGDTFSKKSILSKDGTNASINAHMQARAISR